MASIGHKKQKMQLISRRLESELDMNLNTVLERSWSGQPVAGLSELSCTDFNKFRELLISVFDGLLIQKF